MKWRDSKTKLDLSLPSACSYNLHIPQPAALAALQLSISLCSSFLDFSLLCLLYFSLLLLRCLFYITLIWQRLLFYLHRNRSLVIIPDDARCHAPAAARRRAHARRTQQTAAFCLPSAAPGASTKPAAPQPARHTQSGRVDDEDRVRVPVLPSAYSTEVKCALMGAPRRPVSYSDPIQLT